jgi:hypothetical protein
VLEPPLADECLAARFDLLTRRRVDHVGVVGTDLVMQSLGRMAIGASPLVRCSRMNLCLDDAPRRSRFERLKM